MWDSLLTGSDFVLHNTIDPCSLWYCLHPAPLSSPLTLPRTLPATGDDGGGRGVGRGATRAARAGGQRSRGDRLAHEAVVHSGGALWRWRVSSCQRLSIILDSDLGLCSNVDEP